MKQLSLVIGLLSLLGPVTASASPAVGDMLSLSVSRFSNQGMGTDILTWTLLDFDEANAEFVMRTELDYFDGESVGVVAKKPRKELLSSATVRAILDSCGSAPRQRRERISVPAGEFDTCRIQNGQDSIIDDVWVGQVPFGLVKTHFEDLNEGLSITREALRFTFGSNGTQLP